MRIEQMEFSFRPMDGTKPEPNEEDKKCQK